MVGVGEPVGMAGEEGVGTTHEVIIVPIIVHCYLIICPGIMSLRHFSKNL